MTDRAEPSTSDDGRRPPAESRGAAPVVVPGRGDPDAALPAGVGVGVVVPAGGTSRRFGGDKLVADLAGRTVLARTVGSVRGAVPGAPVVVVGPPGRAQQVDADVRVVGEEPAGAGPAAAVLAGARALPAVGGVGVVAVVPGDAPWAGQALPALVAAVRTGAAAAVAVAPDGRRQHLLLAVRADHVAGLDASSLVDAPVRALLAGLAADQVVEVRVDARAALDVDDHEALARARAAVREPGPGTPS